MNIINNKYKLLERIGQGNFGSIYKGKNIRTNESVAIKIEPIIYQLKLLKNESKIYQYLNGYKNIPNVKWFGKDDVNYYMVINLLGDSLYNLKRKLGHFSLKLTLKIGIKILQLLKIIHDKGLVHRDLKPDNFLFGLNDKDIYIIDFGFCKSYLNNGKHINEKKISNLIGSKMYASINSHNLIELSRRDDLESLGYMLIYFYLENQLPWYNIEKEELIKEMKQNIMNDVSMPTSMINYMQYVRTLKFEETPSYDLIIRNLTTELKELG